MFFLIAEGTYYLKAQNHLHSCINYPYQIGIDYKQTPTGSFQLLSTSIVKIKGNKGKFHSGALKEANLRAKSNISSFVKSINSTKIQTFKKISLPIRLNGRIIKTNKKLKNKIKSKIFESHTILKGVRQVAMCSQENNYVMVTVEITNESIDAAKFIGDQ
tara:strand:+ start:798 stop:1277 length:480 start_codon:yes stop_codon:yes gene_type:complete